MTSLRPPLPLHLFVDDRAELLERWQQAFDGARAAPLAAAKKVLRSREVAAVWVRLPAKKAALRRLQAVVDAAGPTPVLVLADAPHDDQALELLSMGARAYINTHAAAPLLQRAWAAVDAGGLWVGEGLKRRLALATTRAGVAIGPTVSAAALAGALEKQSEVSGRFLVKQGRPP